MSVSTAAHGDREIAETLARADDAFVAAMSHRE